MITCLTQQDKSVINIIFNNNKQLKNILEDKDTTIELCTKVLQSQDKIIKDQKKIIERDQNDSLALSNSLIIERKKVNTLKNKNTIFQIIIGVEAVLLLIKFLI
jgi:hypothetical protein